MTTTHADEKGNDASVLDKGLTLALLGLALLLGGTWGLNLLAWPWWPDLDTFAELAQGWAEGEPPYRTIAAHSFPGQIYLFALLGWAFGWGATWPVYAADAALLLGLGWLLSRWSRSIAGSAVPGLLGFLAFSTYYQGLGYTMVAQRDWQAAALGSMAVLVLQSARRGRPTAAVAGSAALFVLASTLRPHVALWLPGLALALADLARSPDEPAQTPHGQRSPTWAILGLWATWGLLAVGISLLVWLPMILGGLVRPMVANLQAIRDPAAYGTPLRWGELGTLLAGQALDFRYLAVVAGLLALSPSGDRAGRSARAWLVVLGCVWWYQPISPARHDYLVIPLRLVGSIGLGALLILARVRFRQRLGGTGRPAELALTFLVLALAVPGRPAHCLIRPAIDGVRALRAGQEPASAPSGYVSLNDQFVNYPWADARAVREFLRRRTPSNARVANLLQKPIALNGATGRRSLLRNESGFYFTRLVRGDYQARLVAGQLAAVSDGGPEDRVVWNPAEFAPGEPLGLDPTLAPFKTAVETHFAREASFGAIEVWKRTDHRASPSPTPPFDARPLPPPG